MNDIDFKSWWTFALSVYAAVLGIVVWLRKPGEAAGEAVTKLRNDVMGELRAMRDQMSGEVSDLRSVQDTLEERVKHLPDSNDLLKLVGAVSKLEARTEGLVNSQNGQTQALGRIENYLLNRSLK
jgi:uncharacterized protein YPO0396